MLWSNWWYFYKISSRSIRRHVVDMAGFFYRCVDMKKRSPRQPYWWVKRRSHDMDYFRQRSCLETWRLLKKLLQLPNLELDSLLSRFYGPVQTKKSMNGVCKTNIDCSFIRGMVENYCTLDRIYLSLLFTEAPVNSRPRLNFTPGTITFHHSPHEQSIFVYYDLLYYLN